MTFKPVWIFTALGPIIAMALLWSYLDTMEETGREFKGRVVFCARVGIKETLPSWCSVRIDGLEKPAQVYMLPEAPGHSIELTEERHRISGRIQFTVNSGKH